MSTKPDPRAAAEAAKLNMVRRMQLQAQAFNLAEDLHGQDKAVRKLKAAKDAAAAKASKARKEFIAARQELMQAIENLRAGLAKFVDPKYRPPAGGNT